MPPGARPTPPERAWREPVRPFARLPGMARRPVPPRRACERSSSASCKRRSVIQFRPDLPLAAFANLDQLLIVRAGLWHESRELCRVARAVDRAKTIGLFF